MSIEALDNYHTNHEPGPLFRRYIAEVALSEEIIADSSPQLRLNRGVQRINDALWMAEHHVRGNHSLIDPKLPYQVLSSGLRDIELCVGLKRDTTGQYGSNILMARTVFEWLCNTDRNTDYNKLNSVMDVYLESIAANVYTQYEYFLSENSKIFLNKIKPYNYKSLLGPILEAMVIGLVTEDQQFRDSKIIALPAPPIFEQTSAINSQPSDILLWQIVGKSINPVGGIQCKAKRKSRGNKPLNNFTITYRSKNTGGSLRTADTEIKDWLNQENLEQLHDKLMYFVSNSRNYILLTQLGI